MHNNKLQGPIPSSISYLFNLSELDLSSNNLSGIVDLQLFSELQKLESLDLSYNILSLVFDVNVSHTFPSLQSLGLSSCNISQIPKIVRDSIFSLDLDLSNNKIQNIPEWIWNMGTLSSLNLSRNFFKNFEQLQFLKSLQSSHCLRSLSISNNGLTGEIPSTICNISCLEILDLSRNNLSGTIPTCMSRLQNLDLSNNNMSGTIPTSMRHLEVLNLRMNKFRGKIHFGLKYLNLNGNQFEGGIPEAIANCSELEVLDIGNNELHGTFPHWLGALPSLRVIVLRSNKLHGSLSDSKTNYSFSELRILDLSHNHFSGPLPTILITNLKKMMNISEDQQDQTFEGDGEDSIETFPSIYYAFSVGLIEKGIYMENTLVLIQLTIINLSNNKFEGEIPDVIGKLKFLKGLDLSSNNFSGHIPPSMGNLVNLEWLDLSSNSLGGQIPRELTLMPWLAVLNLSYNHLVGPIPQGKQFNTFANTSYEGNPGLCEFPLSKSCSNVPKNHRPPPVSFQEKDHELWEFGWRIVLLGFGCGLSFGMFMGFLIFQTGKPKWFVNLVDNMQFRRKKKVKKAPRRVPRRN